MAGRSTKTPWERFWPKVRVADDGCWEWVGTVERNGYGYFWTGQRLEAAHRAVLALVGRPIPYGLDVDHLCRNRRCVHPLHLEPVTRLENVRRGLGHGRETHCPRGHAYEGENLIRRQGKRYCRECKRITERARRAAKREARNAV